MHKKLLLAMKLTIVLLTAAILNVNAKGVSQTVTFSGTAIQLEKLFQAIEMQTGYVFFYSGSQLKESRPVTISVKDMPLEHFLKRVLHDQFLEYSIENKNVIISRKEKIPEQLISPPSFFLPPPSDIEGSIVNQNGQPVIASVIIKGTRMGTTSDMNGKFVLKGIENNSILVITATNIEKLEWPVNGKTTVMIVVKMVTDPLDEVVFKGYYSESKRLSTGSVSKVTAETIEKQPVSNVLQALQGRVPGLVIEQSSGYTSSSFKVEIRGRNSISFASDPLYVVDGVPLTAGSGDVFRGGLIQSGFPGPAGGQSPLNSINPSSIESIEVLRDADATAIYGSQGANGVILITTKKAKAGKTVVDISAYSGFGKVTRMADLMNTQQYLEMRREAFKNDGLTPDEFSAPDLVKWDQNRYTDWQDYLIGGTAGSNDAQVSVSGGDQKTQVRIGGGFHKETTVFPGDQNSKRGSAHFTIAHKNLNDRLTINANINYSANKDNYIPIDLTTMILLPPNAPAVVDSAGDINWSGWEPDYYPDNLASMRRGYRGTTTSLMGNVSVKYLLLPGLYLKTNAGYTEQENDQFFAYPGKISNPAFGASTGGAAFGNTAVKTWIIEPQAEYATVVGDGKLQLVAGATLQENISEATFIYGVGYANDALLESLISAPAVIVFTDNYAKYRYNAFFGRINYNWKSKYLFNITARRDGSSRFGPGKQFGNFGAAGIGWIFSEENFVKNSLGFLSFGKIRGSYGTTGSANIGDYVFLSSWQNTSNPYLGGPGFYPTRHLNRDYRWERNKKLEAALELGFLKEKLSLSVAWYKNSSDNQLVGYSLPAFTGFSSVIANFPAVVENTGWEVLLNTININKKDIKWTSSFNISINKNKLVSFPDIESSPYNYSLVVGRPLTAVRSYHYGGVDPQTGGYILEDLNKDGVLDSEDYVSDNSYSPKFTGGFLNELQYKNWSLNMLFQFVKQKAPGTFSNTGVSPGQKSDAYGNQPVSVLARWQKPGDIAEYARFSTNGTDIYIGSTDRSFIDASYVRLKNISLSYSFPASWMSRIRFSGASIFARAQNLATITKYDGVDPETQTVITLPPLKFITFGFNVSI